MSRPVVASYCTTFLKREMRHIYRQVSGLREVGTFVITRSRENREEYPFADVEVLPRPRIFFLKRFYKKYLAGEEALFYRGEYKQLTRLLERRNPDLVHVYFGHTGVHLLPFIRTWRGRALVSFHGMDIMPREDEPGYLDRLRELLQVLPMVLARSESLAARLVDLGCAPEKIRINRTGIPLDAYPFLQRTPPPDGAWHIVQASRLIEKKGLDNTLEAFAIFQKTHPAARLTIAGDGPLGDPLRQMADGLGIGPAVRFAGFQSQEELARLYASAHLFMHPSRMTAKQDQEGVPNSMLEAMATGLPVVATLHGGIPEAVEDGRDGLLTPENDSAALAAALERISGSPELFGQLGSNAAQSVRRKYEQAAAIRSLEGFYRELIAAKPV
jgi:colanic acid/amylovoran biosynthesis glycosyltransferase